MSCGVGHRRGSDLVLLGLWHRPAATALIHPLAWELPYDMGAPLKSKKKKKKLLEGINEFILVKPSSPRMGPWGMLSPLSSP